MILTVDIGNSLTKWGLWEGPLLEERFASATASLLEPGTLEGVLEDLRARDIRRAAACSVVPSVNPVLASAVSEALGVELAFVTGESELGMPVAYETRATLGADRIVAAYGALRKYGAPCVVCDFGTATTIDLVADDGTYAGGLIAPGIGMLCESLASRTAQLMEVSPKVPEKTVGTSTAGAIESGVFAAAVGTLETALGRMASEIKLTPKVVATGGYARLIAEGTRCIDVIDENLVMEGLRYAADR